MNPHEGVTDTELDAIKCNEEFDRTKVQRTKEGLELRKKVTLEREEEEVGLPLMLDWRQRIKTERHLEVKRLSDEPDVLGNILRVRK